MKKKKEQGTKILKEHLKHVLYSDELTQQDRFNCCTYALNCLSGPRMVEHFRIFWEGVSKDLQNLAEDKAKKILAKRSGK